jgi:hypothetical protein
LAIASDDDDEESFEAIFPFVLRMIQSKTSQLPP